MNRKERRRAAAKHPRRMKQVGDRTSGTPLGTSRSEAATKTIEVTIGARSQHSEVALLSPVNEGRSVNLRPSARAVSAMRERSMTHVRASWQTGEDGHVQWLCIRAAAAGEPGLKIRYENADGKLRPHVYIPTWDVGRATIEGFSVCQDEQIDGDTFQFRIPAGLSFEGGER